MLSKVLANTLPALLVLPLVLPACYSSSDRIGGEAELVTGDAYEVAGKISLPRIEPQDRPDLQNVFDLSGSIVSGGEPHTEDAFASLAERGIKTIVSVDGKIPDAEAARRHGLRYVHVPIRYSGIEYDELVRLAKTFRELEAPFYVHCFHGKHRGPAAAAVGRVVLDGASRQRAVAEMRQWCGTSSSYSGLYASVASAPYPAAEETAVFRWSFPVAHPMSGFRESMVPISRAYDHLKSLAGRDWRVDPAHPDIDALNEAEILLESFRGSCELDEVATRPEDFRGWLTDSVRSGEKLIEELKRLREGRSAGATEAMRSIGASCQACHQAYRNS
jgi:protein tyrosine phosphatase (PTP) superfamily phosphohydrolase (DUF442 family)